VQVHLHVGDGVGQSDAPSTEVASMPSLMMKASKGVPAMIDWPTMVCVQAEIAPAASRPRRTRLCHIGR
jgi:hypothetical protein